MTSGGLVSGRRGTLIPVAEWQRRIRGLDADAAPELIDQAPNGVVGRWVSSYFPQR